MVKLTMEHSYFVFTDAIVSLEILFSKKFLSICIHRIDFGTVFNLRIICDWQCVHKNLEFFKPCE